MFKNLTAIIAATLIALAIAPANATHKDGPHGDSQKLDAILNLLERQVDSSTNLLFAFVTNRVGLDTGIAISNTTLDPLGTELRDGTCTIHYFGSVLGGGTPPPDTSAVIPAGEQLIFLLSSGNAAQEIDGAPEFQGYLIAKCDFPLARGFALIEDGFGSIAFPTRSSSYLAEVIPTDR